MGFVDFVIQQRQSHNTNAAARQLAARCAPEVRLSLGTMGQRAPGASPAEVRGYLRAKVARVVRPEVARWERRGAQNTAAAAHRLTMRTCDLMVEQLYNELLTGRMLARPRRMAA